MDNFASSLKVALFTEHMVNGDVPHTVAVAIFNRNKGGTKVLIGKRKAPPAKDEWALPGGHLQQGENAYDAALREVAEETGIKLDRDGLTYIQHRQGAPERSIVDYVFAYDLIGDEPALASSDLKKLYWAEVNQLPSLAFNDDRYILQAHRQLYGNQMTNELLIHKTVEILESISPTLYAAISKRSVLNEESFQHLIDKKPSSRKGTLIAFCGVEGSGKTTQVEKLVEWLEKQDYNVLYTKWNSSKLLKDAILKAKKKKIMSPLLYSLMHMADMIIRYENDILPHLNENGIVVCDRYYYTSIVRDKVRGVDTGIHDIVYKNYRKPDLLFHCVVPIEIAFHRLADNKGLKYYGAGLDLGLSASKEESCAKYETLMDKIYKEILPKEPNYHELNTDRSIDDIFREVRKALADKFCIGVDLE